MRTAIISAAAVMLLVACQPPKASTETETKDAKATGVVTKESLKSTEDKLNYSVGFEIGKNIKRNGLPLTEAIFMKGIHDGIDEAAPLLNDEEMMKVKQDHSKAQREAKEKEREEAGKKSKAEGEKFMKENGAKEGIVTTASGLQYKVLTEGKGAKPVETDKVSVNYKGTLIDGTEFDSSYTRGKPAEFAVNRVVKGWTEALQLMPVGSKWQVFIPSELGYGDRGAGAKIAPNSVLIFEMELVDIVKADAAPTPGPGAKMPPPGMPKMPPKPTQKPAEK